MKAICKICYHYELCKADERCLPEYLNCNFFKNKLDVVEVVRCKDCKHWNKTDTDIIVNIDYGKCTNSNSPYHNEEETTGGDYCSCGERKCDNG